MENISNEKIEKVRADREIAKSELAKSKVRTLELYAKIRDYDKQLETLEAFEIAVRYRALIVNEDFSAQLKANKNKTALTGMPDSAAKKEVHSDANLKTE
jgi:hypothetical protein